MQKKDLVSLMTIRTAATATKKKKTGKKSCYCTHAKKKKRRRMHFQLHFRLLDMLAELQTENSEKKKKDTQSQHIEPSLSIK